MRKNKSLNQKEFKLEVITRLTFLPAPPQTQSTCCYPAQLPGYEHCNTSLLVPDTPGETTREALKNPKLHQNVVHKPLLAKAAPTQSHVTELAQESQILLQNCNRNKEHCTNFREDKKK